MQTLELSEYQNGYTFGWKGKAKLDNGLTVRVKILQDDPSFRDGPREWDNLGTMVCWHRNYILGDEQPSQDPDDYLRDLACALDDTLEDRIWYWESENGWSYLASHFDDPVSECDKRVQAIIDKVLDEQIAVMLDLYLYDHSGITMSYRPFSCPWDSGQVGYIYVTKETLRKEYSVKRVTKSIIDRARKVLQGEVETYDDYLTGNVWGYDIEITGSKTCDACGNVERPVEFEDSCWGFYGDPRKWVLEEVNAILEKRGVKVEF